MVVVVVEENGSASYSAGKMRHVLERDFQVGWRLQYEDLDNPVKKSLSRGKGYRSPKVPLVVCWRLNRAYAGDASHSKLQRQSQNYWGRYHCIHRRHELDYQDASLAYSPRPATLKLMVTSKCCYSTYCSPLLSLSDDS